MIKEIKCDNCGASLKTNPDQTIRFCPYCGFAMAVPDDAASLEKFRLKHEEAVRQRKIKEKEAEEKRDNKRFLWCILGAIAAIIILSLLLSNPNVSEEARLRATVTKVQQLILDGDYDTALVEAQSIRVKKDGWFDGNFDMWENQRKDLINLIERKKRESR